MNYTEWCDELKRNLLGVSESERRRVLDYYAEAYADRREAGFSEREIIQEFGAPYDAAQRILSENRNGGFEQRAGNYNYAPPPPPPPAPQPVQPQPAPAEKPKKTAGWVKGLIAGIAIIVALAIIAVIVLFCVSSCNSPKFTMQTFTSEEEITALKIKLNAGSIETVYSDDNIITVEYPVSENFTTTCSLENGVLSISNGNRHWYNFGWSFKIPAITVKIPKDAVYDLDLYLNAGHVELEKYDYGSVKLHLNAGSLDMEKTTCSDFTCEINAGSVDVEGLSSEKIFVKLNAGTFNADDVVCPDIETKLNAGSASFDIIGVKSEYSVFVEKNAGSCNVSNAKGSTDKEIRAKINAGSLSFEFSN